MVTMTNGAAVEKRVEEEVARREPTRGVPRYRPVVDILELNDELQVYADMPGTKPEDIDIKFENGVLTIHGKVEPRQPEDTDYLIHEYGVGDFYRAFEVSEAVDSERISADYRDGVLVLHLPKVERAKARKIQVHAN
jgi:HSP20 family molecular chaperone IbpA